MAEIVPKPQELEPLTEYHIEILEKENENFLSEINIREKVRKLRERGLKLFITHIWNDDREDLYIEELFRDDLENDSEDDNFCFIYTGVAL